MLTMAGRVLLCRAAPGAGVHVFTARRALRGVPSRPLLHVGTVSRRQQHEISAYSRYLSSSGVDTIEKNVKNADRKPLSTDAHAAAAASVAAAAAPALPLVANPAPSDYVTATLELSKARLSALVVVTTTAGFLTAGGPVSYPTLAAAAAGTALCSSSASTLNQIFEMERDKKMKRTRHRPLVRGVVTPQTAAALATATGLGGGSMLALGTDPVTASLGIGNIALYAGLYTYMKPRSELNTWVGAVVGAVPPVMGWTAATGGSLWDLEAALLGGTLFLWQFPHFFALSWMHRTDYARGGFQMVPVNDVDTNGDRTAALINRYTWYMSSIPLVSSVLGATSSMFAVEGIALNAYALYVAKRFDRDRTNANARKVFLTSLWYLPCLMTLFILHSRRWKEPIDGEVKDAEATREMEEDAVAILRRRVSQVRNAGRELCLHELFAIADKEEESNDKKIRAETKCPVALGKSKVTEATEAGATIASAVASGAPTAKVAVTAGGIDTGK